ncbi:MAG: hypothetical protein ACD_41C00288G0003 [uncultured bacterium]|nr:MAG: hypothetical protein ACD_41C00288G0003 [uncultured bacterium]HBY74120.1 hypothetical protein [Candidatus Kerfeldbacteria bacterium]
MPTPNNLAPIFSQLPSQQLLAVAKDIQLRLLQDNRNYDVTPADYAVQRIILDYFAQSDLAGTYRISSEEIVDLSQQVDSDQATWELIIDPLDGTHAFCRQEDTWGVMVGARDLAGKLIYSWNLVSTGDIYSSTTAARRPLSHRTKLERVDVYDYGVNQTQFFSEQTSYPAAVWAGWQLYQEQLDGLIWLPSTAGKKIYPDYDLIFLGALEAQGWQVYRKRERGNVVQIAVARTEENIMKLLNIRV